VKTLTFCINAKSMSLVNKHVRELEMPHALILFILTHITCSSTTTTTINRISFTFIHQHSSQLNRDRRYRPNGHKATRISTQSNDMDLCENEPVARYSTTTKSFGVSTRKLNLHRNCNRNLKVNYETALMRYSEITLAYLLKVAASLETVDVRWIEFTEY
jgi:hypothetical protein